MVILLGAALALFAYTYIGYPVLLALLGRVWNKRPGKMPSAGGGPPAEWPAISIVLPVYNEAESIAATLERVLAIDYPAERRQVVVVSDASTDGSDEIIARFAARGVELLRLPQRRGKTAAENAARSHLSGAIIINTDASVRIEPGAVKQLVEAFADPSVGVASGRDVSVANLDDRTNPGEMAYVGYEMRVRDLETQLDGIVGASGCLYAIRRDLHVRFMPEHLSRDFGAALVAREQGYRAVSVPAAICYVPRSMSVRREYRRKVRTMARGLRTLWHKRALLNPRQHGVFAWMLWSHKLCRWLTPWVFVVAAAALAALVTQAWWATATLLLGAVAALLATVAWFWPEGRPLPRAIALPAYGVTGNIAALHAWVTAVGGRGTALWEPTRRGLSRGQP